MKGGLSVSDPQAVQAAALAAVDRLIAVGDARLPVRFWAKVSNAGGCWVWTGAKTNPGGYGKFNFEGSSWRAHRLSYERLVAAIPAGKVLDHLCRNPPCVNPAHLEPVTRRENTLRGDNPSAWNAVKTHCPQLHELSGYNLYVAPTGERHCRMCRNAYHARRPPRKR